jgi:hypothetical protein
VDLRRISKVHSATLYVTNSYDVKHFLLFPACKCISVNLIRHSLYKNTY